MLQSWCLESELECFIVRIINTQNFSCHLHLYTRIKRLLVKNNYNATQINRTEIYMFTLKINKNTHLINLSKYLQRNPVNGL